MWQHWQRIIKEEAEKYGYGQKTEIEEAKAPRFPKGFKQGETLWVPPGNDRGELVSWKAGKNPGGIFTVKLFKTGKTVEVSAVDIYKANSPKLLSTKEEVEEAYAPLDTKGIVGAFTEATKKKRFEYRNSTDSWGKSHGLPHEVCVSSPGGGLTQWRSANVKGTVCYIAVDEGADGKPVMEKWAIRNHVKYVKAESVEVEVDEAFNPADHGFRIDKEEVEQIEEAKMLTGPGKKDPKRLVGIYTMRGKWIKDMNSEAEAKAFVNKSWGESVEESNNWKQIYEAKADEAANLANEIRKVAKNNGVSITVESNTSVSFSKDFTKGNMDEFFAAYRDCDQVRRMVKFKSRGNEWGCGSSGFGIGAQECVKSGKVRLSKSGDGASYLLKTLSKRF